MGWGGGETQLREKEIKLAKFFYSFMFQAGQKSQQMMKSVTQKKETGLNLRLGKWSNKCF